MKTKLDMNLLDIVVKAARDMADYVEAAPPKEAQVFRLIALSDFEKAKEILLDSRSKLERAMNNESLDLVECRNTLAKIDYLMSELDKTTARVFHLGKQPN